ncbi:hypothetical protein SIAM614_12843 [Stappia aggregata IAM 12614]|uniref:DUF1036 domain-containing protein n=2 Tax=Roseibium aggregatum TaxID=187304 RepID=A0NQ44_ROSAI|nr:hypothetical protein SIAM614_12843 [Stappia aggregata IAM 12614] [Roseibium aggregatum IAM 12614]
MKTDRDGGKTMRRRRVRARSIGFIGAAALAGILLASSAHAGLRVCNGSVDLVNVALGYETDEGLRTEGWWTITANACSQVLQEPLKKARYYLHVADGFGESRLGGDITLCIREEKFVLYDGDQCWQRGLIEADFFQVETEGKQDWTVLLSYD